MARLKATNSVNIDYSRTQEYRQEFQRDRTYYHNLARKIVEKVNSKDRICICCPAEPVVRCINGHLLCEDCIQHACVGCALLA